MKKIGFTASLAWVVLSCANIAVAGILCAPVDADEANSACLKFDVPYEVYSSSGSQYFRNATDVHLLLTDQAPIVVKADLEATDGSLDSLRSTARDVKVELSWKTYSPDPIGAVVSGTISIFSSKGPHYTGNFLCGSDVSKKLKASCGFE